MLGLVDLDISTVPEPAQHQTHLTIVSIKTSRQQLQCMATRDPVQCLYYEC
jgi:hypothetical protein